MTSDALPYKLSVIDGHVVLSSVDTGETVAIEFKEMVLDIDFLSRISEDEVITYIRNGTYPSCLNELIEMNLISYFKRYIAKYIASFINTPLITEGLMYFGIADNRIVTGIPYIGEFMTAEYVKELILDSCGKIKIVESMESHQLLSKETLSKLVDVKIHNVTRILDDDIDDSLASRLKAIEDEYDAQLKTYYEYRDMHNIWMSKFRCYDRKVLSVGNDPLLRADFLEFIRTYESKPLETREKAIQRFSTDEVFDYPLDDIIHLKLDDTHPMFWITEYKDARRMALLAQRPRTVSPPSYDRKKRLTIQLFSLLCPMIHQWIRKGISYYVIELRIDTGTFSDSDCALYEFGDKWHFRRRGDTIDNGPSCIDC